MSDEKLALLIGISAGTLGKAALGEELISESKSDVLLEKAEEALAEKQVWTFWPERHQQEFFQAQRAMDRFDPRNKFEQARHRAYTFSNMRMLEGLVGYDSAMVQPPENLEATPDNACWLFGLGWTYTDVAQQYVEAPSAQAVLFQRTEHCFARCMEMLGPRKLNEPYLYGRALLARAGAKLASIPLAKLESDMEFRNWLKSQNIPGIVLALLKKNEFDWHVLLQGLVLSSVERNRLSCLELYDQLCTVHPSFEDWDEPPDGIVRTIRTNKHLSFFRSIAAPRRVGSRPVDQAAAA